MIQLPKNTNRKELPQRASNRFRRSILLVDDDRNSIDALSRWFEQAGYETKPTFHPLYGLMMAAEQRFDAAVVDINMPDMNGMEFLQELLRLETFPVIVLTDGAEPSLMKRANELGASACFAKSTNMDVVRASIEQAICRH